MPPFSCFVSSELACISCEAEVVGNIARKMMIDARRATAGKRHRKTKLDRIDHVISISLNISSVKWFVGGRHAMPRNSLLYQVKLTYF